MVSWLDNFDFQNQYDLVDFFAGAGRLARGGRVLGENALALDIEYHPNSRVFDINTEAGFAFLVLDFISFMCFFGNTKQQTWCY